MYGIKDHRYSSRIYPINLPFRSATMTSSCSILRSTILIGMKPSCRTKSKSADVAKRIDTSSIFIVLAAYSRLADLQLKPLLECDRLNVQTVQLIHQLRS